MLADAPQSQPNGQTADVQLASDATGCALLGSLGDMSERDFGVTATAVATAATLNVIAMMLVRNLDIVGRHPTGRCPGRRIGDKYRNAA